MAGNEVTLSDEVERSLLDRREEYNLSDQELTFVYEYLIDFDSERAYIATHAIELQNPVLEGRRLSIKPDILQAVTSELRAQGEKLFLRKEAVLARVWAEALDMRSKANVRLKALEIAARMIGSLDYERSAVPPNINIHITKPKFEIQPGEKKIGDTIKNAISIHSEKS